MYMADAQPPPYYEPSIPFAEQRSDLRAGIGRRVGDNLDATPRLWRLCSGPGQPIQLYIADAFLDPETCAQMCAKIDEGSYLRRSTTRTSGRTSAPATAAISMRTIL